MSAYSEARRKTAEKMAGGGESGGSASLCTACGMSTAYDTLSLHGGRCFPCYAAHTRETAPKPERSQAAERIRSEIADMGRSLPL